MWCERLAGHGRFGSSQLCLTLGTPVEHLLEAKLTTAVLLIVKFLFTQEDGTALTQPTLTPILLPVGRSRIGLGGTAPCGKHLLEVLPA